ncbi:unnamed protein product [Trypanosoma congolense IL3000]|uniref:WGS project CAEQ00000000 data, annotated contig 1173 n=1 Tax=Trypanosoma congolense (strain IL3000) TaxID=1068625 RepID=F9W4D8_TRYCI|nr:unnamed protein product [Trypanosoma congolense IL3000]
MLLFCVIALICTISDLVIPFCFFRGLLVTSVSSGEEVVRISEKYKVYNNVQSTGLLSIGSDWGGVGWSVSQRIIFNLLQLMPLVKDVAAMFCGGVILLRGSHWCRVNALNRELLGATSYGEVLQQLTEVVSAAVPNIPLNQRATRDHHPLAKRIGII